MYNKISEQHIRQEKVNKLKQKIRSEVRDEISRIREWNSKVFTPLDIDVDDVIVLEEAKQLIDELSCLNAIEVYINDENSFMHYEYYNESDDTVVYTVSDEILSVMSCDDFNFVDHVLFCLESADRLEKHDIVSVLNDAFIICKLVSAFDIIVYRNKLNENVDS